MDIAQVKLSLAILHNYGISGRSGILNHLLASLGGHSTIDRQVLLWKIVKYREQNGWDGDEKHAWIVGSAAARATHHLIIWDDVVICQDFINTALFLAELQPQAIYNLGSWSPQAHQARKAGGHWIIGQNPYPGAILIPRNKLVSFVSWSALYSEEDDATPDSLFRFGMWLLHSGEWVYIPTPSLLQYTHHTDSLWDRLMGRPKQRAPYFVGTEGDPLLINWHEGLDTPALEPAPRRFYRALWKLKSVPHSIHSTGDFL